MSFFSFVVLRVFWREEEEEEEKKLTLFLFPCKKKKKKILQPRVLLLEEHAHVRVRGLAHVCEGGDPRDGARSLR